MQESILHILVKLFLSFDEKCGNLKNFSQIEQIQVQIFPF